MKLTRRLQALESKQALVVKPFRVVIAQVWKRLNLATSTCRRTRWEDGSVLDVVHLDGTDTGLSSEDLEKFIASFPIDPARNAADYSGRQ